MRNLLVVSGLAALCLLAGCEAPLPEQHKRVWVMNIRDIYLTVKAPDGALTLMPICGAAPVYRGLHADIAVRYSSERRCYYVDSVQPLN